MKRMMPRLSMISMGVSAALAGAGASPAATLPAPCLANSCAGNGGPANFVTSGSATATITGSTLRVNQSSANTILNWSNFNVSADGHVVFNQPTGNSIALNRIFQGSPSQIFGSITANGQIYLVNQNGFLFGSTSSVNVGGLLASSLAISDSTFASGLLSPIQNGLPALTYTPGPDGQPLASSITVQAGATLSTAGPGQRIILAAPTVTNGGSISTPDGQAILASGQSVFLYASTDPKLRGLLVEVDGAGTTTNQVTGSVSADRGNVTLIGLAVNQNGRVSATTSTSENGSVRLLARDSTSSDVSFLPSIGGPQFAVQPGGTLELGPQSVTSVLPDPTDHSTVVDAQAQLPSTIELSGLHVGMAGGSQINAPDGKLTVTAAADLASPLLSSPGTDPSIRIDSGAAIDLAGSDASVPVTRNLVTVQLRGTELADSPVQRDGPLRGQTVIVDARADGGNGTPLANVSGEIALTQRGINERLDQGGTATFSSTGDIGVANGATINVSGGAVNYTGGIMQTSYLVKPDGTLVNIAQANPNQPYAGVVTPTIESISDKWGVISFIPSPGIAYYEPGYVQGASAGSLQFIAPTMILNGNFLGSAVNGPYQRSGAGTASGGTFTVGAPNGTSLNPSNFVAPTVQFASAIPNIVFDDSAPLPSSLPLILSTNFMTSGGFTQVAVASNSRIMVPENTPITIAPGGSFSLISPRIDILSSVSVPGGTIAAAATQSASPAAGLTSGLFVGNGVSLDASGSWINDLLAPLGSVPAGLAPVNGGNISLEQTVNGGTLSIGSGVQLLANGGGWFQQSGALSGTFTAGSGGSIALVSNAVNGNGNGTMQFADGLSVQAFGVQGAAGGSFALEAPRIMISSGGSSWLGAQTVMGDPASNSALNIDTSLFSSFGFAHFSLTADGAPFAAAANAAAGASTDVLSVAPHSSIDLNTETLQLSANASSQPTGTQLLNFAQPTLFPAYQRSTSSLVLTANPASPNSFSQVGDILIGSGAGVVGAPNSSLAISGVGSIEFDGSVALPGGSVSMMIATPAAALDPGYVPGQRIELGSTANINVSGTAVYTPNTAGLLQGTLYAGGSVTLDAQRGSVITDAGSSIDFSGTQAPFDFPGSAGSAASSRTTLASAGGSLTVASPESIALLGGFSGAGGVGSQGSAFGGSLSVELLSQIGNGYGQSFPAGPRVIEVTNQLTPADSDTNGLAVLTPQQIAASGITSLTLLAADRIEFDGGVTLALGQSLVMQSPALSVGDGSSVSVSAPYLAIGTGTSAQTGNLIAAATTPGPGTLKIQANNVDIVGTLSFQGASTVSIVSTGDITLRGNEANSLTDNGSLSMAGSLTLTAQRVLPSTAAQFTITDVNPDAGAAGYTVQFEQAGPSPGTPLSVAGSITVNADNIVQAGTILAPFGTISLNANPVNGSLLLAAGSTTSVSGNGALLPYGILENGTVWEYGLAPLILSPVTSVPARQINLTGASVTLAQGATINVSGGGDLSSYQWTPGTGGTTDALANGSIPGLYAVIPALSSGFGPYDPLVYQGSNLQPGQSVYLSGGGGLAAGVYALLPARYALLPGAYLIQAVSGFANVQPGVAAATPDGAPIVAGYLTFAGTNLGAGAGYSGFSIRPGTYSTMLADYTTANASTFFAGTPTSGATAPPNLPADAGSVSIAVQQSLQVLGTVLAAGAPGGQNATISIAAPQIEIDPNADAPQSSGDVHLSAGVISSWHPGRLILGGSQTSPDAIQVDSNNVGVTSGSTLVADEIVMVAGQGISISAGATVESTSVSAGTAPSAALLSSTPLTLTGSGAGGSGASGAAFFAVSDLDYYNVVRTAEPPAALGTVTIASGAKVGSFGAISIDAPGTTQIADGSLTGNGARWSLSSSQIVFGPASNQANVLTVDSSLLAALSAGSSVDLYGANSIDLDVAVNLAPSGGSQSSFREISLFTPTLNNFAGAGSSSFSADTITLGSLGASTPGASTPTAIQGSGSATFSANVIDVGTGTLSLSGFGQTTLIGNDAVVGLGSGGLTASGSLDVRSNLITTQSGATTALSAANGELHLEPGAASASSSTLTPGMGGSLALSGQSILDEANILMPSGEVALTASTQLTLQSGASINVAGILPAVAMGSHGSSGGSISLQSAGGLNLSSGTSLNVSGAAGADAGAIQVSAGGAANLAGSLVGTGDPSFAGGTFTLTAGSLANFNALNQQLAQGGFTAQQSYRVNTGDLALASGSTITAQQVELTADTGSIIINGTINAKSSASRGLIELSAGNDVLIAGALIANAGDASGRGGAIQLSSVQGTVYLEQGSTVAASGVNGTGQLLIRAPGAVSGTDINLSVSTDLSKVDSVLIEPIWSETLASATPAQADIAAIMGDAANFMALVSPNLLARIPQLSASNVALRPFVDIAAPGDLQLPSLDFSAFRFNGQPADVEFRASGNLVVDGTVSDGFRTVTTVTGPRMTSSYLDLALCAGGSICPSTSFTLVAGADFGSADAAATVAGAAADLQFAAGSILRTGTGNLTLAAARDIDIGDTNAGIGASIYTGGSQAAPTAVARLRNPVAFVPTSYGSGDSLISLTAGGNINGVATDESVFTWQPRSMYSPADPTLAPSASWGINFTQFGWSVGALGGGDVAMHAGGNVNNVSAAVADSNYIDAGGVSHPFGGGNLTLSANGDVGSAYLYVADGIGRVNAEGSLNSARSDSVTGAVLGTMLMAGDASFFLSARGDVLLEGVNQPSEFSKVGSPSTTSYFYRYGADSALNVSSSGGSITMNGDAHFADFVEADVNNLLVVSDVLPGTLNLSAFAGDVNINGLLTLFPAARGQLSVVAGKDVTGIFTSGIAMTDIQPSTLPSAGALLSTDQLDGVLISLGLLQSTAVSAIHTGDSTPALISAGGNITNLSLALPKAGTLTAGGDIAGLVYQGQNLAATDVTLITAGRNIAYTADPTSPDFNAGAQISVGGPGELELLAGGSINLGFSRGVTTVGNLTNPNLAPQGANILMLAGQGAPLGISQPGAPNPDDFVANIIGASTAYQSQLEAYVGLLTGSANLSFATAAQDFRGLPEAQQLPLLTNVFFNELTLSGREANNDPALGFSRGYAAIDSLFPASRGASSPYAGDLTLDLSRIYTLQGGSISLLVPGGSVDVGLAILPPDITQLGLVRNASDLGIVAIQSGDVQIYALNDVLVNSSRIFTEGGGNIIVWSTAGNIDAGQGAKTSISAPPPLALVSASGAVTLDFSNTIAGSGIRTISTGADVTAGNVDLDAPVGYVNAGDAGIGSAGNLNIAAQRVIGVDNIQVGGIATGVPPATSGIGAALSGVSAASSSSSSAATSSVQDANTNARQTAPLAENAIGWLDVFVQGLGEENCKPSDMECLKRQKHQ
jgi:filamentous hemagglutinin family protein